MPSYSLGLSGVEYTGYFDADPQWFATATRTGDTELRSEFSPVSPTPDNGYSWQWTGYFKPLSAEGAIADDFTLSMTSDDAGIMWIGAVAITGYNTANCAVSSNGQVAESSAPVTLRADTYYPVRIQYGHPSAPTFAGLGVFAEPALRQANDFGAGCLFYADFEPVSDPYAPWGGFANWQRLWNLNG